MNTKQTIILMMLGATLTTACVSEDHDLAPSATPTAAKKGTLSVSLAADASFDANTRALTEANYRNTNNYTVQLVSAAAPATPIVECLGSQIAENMPKDLEIGSYEVRAFYGTESAASRNDFRVEGSKTFTISAGQTTSVRVDCAPTCGKISVDFDAAMDTYYSDYSVTFGGTAALAANTIAWAKADSEPWYVKLGTTAETVAYTISLTAKSDYAITDAAGNKQTTGTATGTFQIERNKAQKLTIKPNFVAPTEGAVSITITIDDSTNERPVTIEVPVNWV